MPFSDLKLDNFWGGATPPSPHPARLASSTKYETRFMSDRSAKILTTSMRLRLVFCMSPYFNIFRSVLYTWFIVYVFAVPAQA